MDQYNRNNEVHMANDYARLNGLSEQRRIPQFDRPAELPTPAGQAMVSQDDILTKLRFTEEQLIQERRSRSWLESELQSGKTVISTLTAKVDKLTEHMNIESLTMKEIQRQLESTARNASIGNQELNSKIERDQIKLHQSIADISARQRHIENASIEDETRNRQLLEELNNLRYRLESFSLTANEATAEVRATAHELDIEQQRGAENFRAIKDQEHAISVLHNAVESKSDAVKRAVDVALQDIRQKFDNEARSRTTFEQNFKELYSEIRKIIQSQERNLSDRIDAARQSSMQSLERERQEREKSLTIIVEQMRAWEKAVKDTEVQILHKVTEKFNQMEVSLSEEHNLRTKFESGLRSDVEEGFRLMQQASSKRAIELNDSQNELKHRVGNAVRTLQESILLVEKTGETKFGNIEEVVRAEIKSRMETDRNLESSTANFEVQLENIERKILDKINEITDTLNDQDSRIVEELSKTSDQLTESKQRSVADLENKLSLINTRFKEDEQENKEALKSIIVHLEQIQRDYQDAINISEQRTDDKIVEIRREEDVLRAKVSDAESMVQDVKINIEEKMNLRTVQMDQTMEAFKQELRSKFSNKDGEDLETRLKASITSIYTSVSHLVQSISVVKDDLESRVTKKEMDEIEGKLKNLIAVAQEKIVLINEEITLSKEDIATKSTKVEMVEMEDRLKAINLQLQIKDSQLEDLINGIKEEIADRVLKTQMQEMDQRFRLHLNNLESKNAELDKLSVETKEEIKLLSTKQESAEAKAMIEKIVQTLKDDLHAKIEKDKVEHHKLSQETQDQWNLMMSKLTAELVTTTAKTDSLSNTLEGVKLKITDNDTTIRLKMKETAQTQESILNDHLLLFEKIRQDTNDQIKELSEKVEDIPRSLQYNEMQQSEFKRYISEQLIKEQENTSRLLTSIRDNVSSKVNENEFEQLQTEVSTSMQRIHAQIDIEKMSVEQLRDRILEIENQGRARLQEIRSYNEKGIKEQSSAVRQWRESAFKKFEDLEARMNAYPKIIESTAAEVKKIRFELNEKMGLEMVKLEKDVQTLKNDIQSKVSSKLMYESIVSALSPLEVRIERLNNEQTTSQQQPQQALPPLPNAVPVEDTSFTPQTIFKPAHRSKSSLNKSTILASSKPGSLSNLSQRKSSLKEELEKLADIALETQQPNTPPMPAQSTGVGKVDEF